MAVNVNAELPIAITFTDANTHDSTQFKPVYTKVKSYKTEHPTQYFLGDKAFDSSSIRQILLKDKVTPIIKAARTKIKPQYPPEFKKTYKKGTAVERFFSRF
ncbi:MAG: transposase, partial [Candidatus Thermoplasmatota archaeon]